MMEALARWWFAPAPAERLRALRILIGGYALVYVAARLPELDAVARAGDGHFRPVGIVRCLETPLPPSLVLAIAVLTIGLLACMISGFAYRVTAPLAAVALVWTLSYRTSWGMTFHTENLLVLHVLALACAPPKGDHGWPIKLMAVLTTATYLLAGIAKLRMAGMAWIDGEQLRNQIAVDNLRKALFGDPIAPLARLCLEHPGPLVVFSVLTLVIELGAPLALAHKRAGHVWSITAWAFHIGVVLLMNVWFPYALFGFAFLPFIRAEKIVALATTTVVMLRRSS